MRASCLAVPAGSTMTVEYGSNISRGQKRIAVANPQITRPWPKMDTVQVSAMTADTTGASGLPGHVDVPWFATGALIAASTAVDLGVAALTGGGSLIGSILGRNIESPLDRAAKDMLDRAPVIKLEPGAEVVVFLRGALECNDFRH
jgi:type IV secretion system protein TrbI